MSNKKSISFILNPHSGTHSKEELPKLIEAHLDKSKFDYRLIITEYAGHAAELAKQCRR